MGHRLKLMIVMVLVLSVCVYAARNVEDLRYVYDSYIALDATTTSGSKVLYLANTKNDSTDDALYPKTNGYVEVFVYSDSIAGDADSTYSILVNPVYWNPVTNVFNVLLDTLIWDDEVIWEDGYAQKFDIDSTYVNIEGVAVTIGFVGAGTDSSHFHPWISVGISK
jgi:hypothetical protein